MKLFLLNVLLAVLWVLLWGSLSLWTIAVGFALGYLTLLLFTRLQEGNVRDVYGRRVTDGVRFAGWFFGQIVKSNLQLAREILTPGHGMTPRLVRYDVSGLSQAQIAALSNAVTLTPGTLVVDVSGDLRHIYVHCMYARDRDQAVAGIDAIRRRMEQDLFKNTPIPSTRAAGGAA